MGIKLLEEGPGPDRIVASANQHQYLRSSGFYIQRLQDGKCISGGAPTARRRFGENISSSENVWNNLGLEGSRLFQTHSFNPRNELRG